MFSFKTSISYWRYVITASLLIGAANGQVTKSIRNSTFESYPSFTWANNKLELVVMQKGSSLAAVTLTDDPDKLSPLWNPMRMARELGNQPRFDGGTGHFVCVDGFGAMSAEEKSVGLPFHGEAHAQMFKMTSGRDGSSTTVTLTAQLPIVQEVFTRTFRVADDENVVAVESELESLLGFDRPVNWAEHATIGSPFLEPGVTVVDLSGSRSRTRPYDKVDNGPVERRLQGGKDFAWPMAPGLSGQSINLRQTPENPHYLDHAATLLDPTRDQEWVTALHPSKRLIFGYLFKRSEYPWLQYWGNYPPTQKMARGLEFSTQPFDVPRREVITTGTLFDTPLFRWLPAKSKIRTKFLLFYARVPEGFSKVDDVRLENKQIVIEDHAAHKQVKLATTQDL